VPADEAMAEVESHVGNATGAGAGAAAAAVTHAMATEPTMVPLQHTSSEHDAAFETWAKASGIVAELTVGCDEGSGLRGCSATRSIDEGCTVLSVPRELLIDADTIARTSSSITCTDQPRPDVINRGHI